MARLQILELPSGQGDDRPPFVLVVDECAPQRIALGSKASYGDHWQNLADRIGASGVIVTPETVDIPANASTPLPLLDVGEAERAGATQLVDAHERTRLDLCDALLLSQDTTWHQLVEAAGAGRRAPERLCREFDEVTAQPAQVRVYLGDKEIDVQEITRRIIDITKQAAAGRG
ncbi:hypothetical protein OG342_04760 [Streptomyces bobili]|uniref:hypothetical protein n=1 Tax=Streptomyces bobili TaxID=67280 RepID=UPI00225A3C26|nr:hypothetical protein [Streptomyces bobili]MCX5522179.1 hypothetical protein [Streptomyces bobili]